MSRGHHGCQGVLEQASNWQLDAEFGTHVQEECAKKVLAQGELKEMRSRQREGNKVCCFLFFFFFFFFFLPYFILVVFD